jgi:hypothetical protein
MKRILLLSAIALMALATVAGAQMMGNGHYWYSGDGGIPKFTPSNVLDSDIADMRANGYKLSWGPSDVFSWGDTYGYSADTNLESARLVVRAFDLDNNLYCAEGEDPAECGTDADVYFNYYFTWDDDALHVAGDVIDNAYDVIAGPEDSDWAFWKRDHFWMSLDLTGIGAAEGGHTPHYHAHPMALDEAVYSMQIHWSIEGEATEIMYGDDPDFYMGSTTAGGPTATGYWFETMATWDLLFLFAPELQANVGDGYEFKMRFIIPDPDGDDGYGQMFWGVDYTTNTADYGIGYWPTFMLQQDLSQTAVQESSWGSIKQLY